MAKAAASSSTSSSTSIIGPQMTVRGTISGEEDVTVKGRIEGNVNLDAELFVVEGAVVEADLDVQRVDVKGQVKGEITATETIHLHPGSRVTGTLRAPELVVDEGASFRGAIDMDVALPEELARAAV